MLADNMESQAGDGAWPRTHTTTAGASQALPSPEGLSTQERRTRAFPCKDVPSFLRSAFFTPTPKASPILVMHKRFAEWSFKICFGKHQSQKFTECSPHRHDYILITQLTLHTQGMTSASILAEMK